MTVMLSFLLPDVQVSLWSLGFACAGEAWQPAFDGIRLCQLGEVGDEGLGQGVPRLTVLHAEVDVGAGELVDVELGRGVERKSISLAATKTRECRQV